MTYAEALIKKTEIQEQLNALHEAKLRVVSMGQVFSQTDGDARNEITRVDFTKLCKEIRTLEAELASINDIIARFEGKTPSRRRFLRMRGV